MKPTKKIMVENKSFFEMVRRMIYAAGRRAAAGDEFELLCLEKIKMFCETNMQIAVREQIKQGKSWSDIGNALGVSKQAAHKRFS